MEKVYERFRDRRRQRWTAFICYLVSLAIMIVIGVYLYYNAEWLSTYYNWIATLSFLAVLFYLASRPWINETIEISVSVRMYEASQLLEFYSEVDATSRIYFEKAAKKAASVISLLRGFKNKLREANSSFIQKSYEPFEILSKNLETRILPRILAQEDVEHMISVLRGLANLFGETYRQISLDDITSKNKDLEQGFDQRFVGEKSSGVRFRLPRETLNNELVRWLLSITLGFTVIFSTVGSASVVVDVNFTQWLTNPTNLVQILGVAIALGIGIYELIKTK